MKEEIKSMHFHGPEHRETFLAVLRKALVLDSASPLFVPLYVLSAIGDGVTPYVGHDGLKAEALIKASETWPPALAAMARLASTLAGHSEFHSLLEICCAIQETPFFEVALHALRLMFEF